MNNKFKFIKQALFDIPSPANGHQRYYDSDVSGLCLKATKTSKTFYVYRSFHGRPREIRIGKFPEWTIYQAREKARTLIGELQGKTFKHGKTKTRTLEEALEVYLAEVDLKPRTVETYEQSINKHLNDWLGKDLTEITFRMVQERYRSIKGDAVANNAMKPVSAIFNYTQATLLDGNDQPIITLANPVELLRRSKQWKKTGKKKDYLEPHQLKRWYKSIQALGSIRKRNNDEVIKKYFMFVLLSGIRKQDAMTLHSNDIDFIAKKFTLLDSKGGENIELPLTKYSSHYLEHKGYAFPSCDGPHIKNVNDRVSELREELGFHWSLHTLRRTFETTANNIGIPVFTQKRLMTHSITDITEQYAQISIKIMRESAEKINEKLLKQMGAS